MREPSLFSRLRNVINARHTRPVLRQYELIEKVRSYDPDADEALINRAYVFSMKAHGAQVRASGDPYFSHPIEVAGILTDLKLDDETIVTAILHDTIEDTVATPEQIEKLFGANVARLVDGVTKLSKIEAQSENERAAENLRKFLLALSDDIRVLLVKLADRLHNMRTLHHIGSEEKRRRIAKETMDIYAPLAERIGMYEIMNEMQGLAFRELEPDAYASITRRLQQLHEAGGDLVNRIGLGLQLHLSDHGLKAEVTGREKRIPYWPEKVRLIRTEMTAGDEIERLACLCFVVIVPPRTVPPAAVCNLLGGHPEQEEILGAGSSAISMVAPSRVPRSCALRQQTAEPAISAPSRGVADSCRAEIRRFSRSHPVLVDLRRAP